jgi:hypothetical protein
MKCHRTYPPILLSAFVLATSLWAGTEFPAKPGEEVVPNQLLVRYKSGTAGVSVAAMMLPGAQALPLPHVPDLYLVQVPANAPSYYSTQLSQNPLVEYVEPNRIRHVALAAPNDSLFAPDEWDLATIQAVQAWQLIPGVYLTSSTAGAGRIKVAVIDTGADCTHPDFINAGGASQDAASGGQILFSSSQAIVATTHSPQACLWQDDNGHGTHTSGTVAAATNNAQGVAALGYPLELIEYKAMDSTGSGNDANLSTAIHAACDAGASIISMSLGEAQYSQTLQDAVNYAWQKNCLVVAAAGNNGVSQVFYPASANHAMGVSATDSSDSLASFSNFGSVVDIAAPGVGIWSTLPTYANAVSGSINYGSLDGTSMATPHVSALAGLIEMATPNLPVDAVAQRIEQSADATDPTAPSGGWGTDQGYGRINAFRAISGSLRSASVGGIVGQVVNTGGVPVSGAVITANGIPPTLTPAPTDSTGLFRFANLTAGQNATVAVSATGFTSVNLSAAVVAGADTNLTVVLGATTGTFTGLVSDGIVPLAGVVVQALQGGLIQATATTDSSGNYSLVVPVGTYDLRASAMYAVAATVSSQPVTASPSVNVPIQMARMGSISGMVKDGSNNPVAGAIITISGSGYSAGAVADGSGAFSTIPLPAGSYSVTATRASPAFSATLTGVVVTNDQVTIANFGQNVTVTTVPAGLQIIVDTVTLTAPQSFNWVPGSMHTVNVASPQTVVGTRGTFASWSDAGAQSHSVTAPASGSTLTVTATFTTEYLLTLTDSPASGGTVTPNPLSPTNDGFYSSGTVVTLTAAANTGSGFIFGNFTGAPLNLPGTTNPNSVTMSAPRSVTANFGGQTAITVTTNPPGLQIVVDGGASQTAPQSFNWAAGSQHTVAVGSPQAGPAGTRYGFASWSDGLAISHQIIVPATTTTYTANFTTQYLLTLTVSPTGGGTVTPNPASPTGDGYYNSGTPVSVTAAANTGFGFVSFTGDVSGAANPLPVAMSAPHSVTANFGALVNVTVNTSVAGLTFQVDNLAPTTITYTSVWPAGSQHTLTVTSPQNFVNMRATFVNWSDGGAASHVVTAPAGGSITYTANFSTSYLLVLSTSPTAGGTLTANPTSPTSDGFYPSGTVVKLTAAANENYTFTQFSGDLTGSTDPQSVTMTAPHAVTANFSSLSSGGPLAANWNLNEPSGATSFADTSGNGNTGVCAGPSCPTLGVPGSAATAASFNGTNSQIIISDSPSLRLNQFTIALWVYPRQVKGDYQPLLAKEDSSGGHRNYGLYIVPNTLQVRYAVWAGDCATHFAGVSAGQLALNTWNHIAFTYDGTVEKFYINGIPDSSNAASSGSLCQVAVPVKIGREASVFQPFNGNLDGIQIYNQALSAASVSNLYQPLAASWKLDEPFGATSFADATGYGNIGSCSGGSCPTLGVPGKTGTAASFNGANSQITVPDSPSLRLNQFTIALWVYPSRVKGDYQPLLAKEDSSGANRNYGLYIVPNTLQVRYAVWANDCTTRFAANSVGQLALNSWNLVVFTFDGTTESLYINGVLDSSNPAPAASLCQAAVPVKIGREASVFQPFYGNLDDIQIYSQALSAASVSNLYNSLAASWKLDEPSGATSFADASGNGNTGSCSGPSCPTMGVFGKSGTAASFNGINDQITIPDSPSLRLNQFTIALWVYPTQLKGDYQPLLAKEDSSGANRNYGLYIAPNSMQIRYSVWASDCATRFAANSVGQLALDTWNFVVFTYDGTTESLYINGVLDSSNPAASPSLCQAGVPVKIGSETSVFLPFIGNLDNIQIYGQALSAAAVSSLYSSF